MAERRPRNNQRPRLLSYAPEDAQRWESLLHRHAWAVRDLQEDYYPLPEHDVH